MVEKLIVRPRPAARPDEEVVLAEQISFDDFLQQFGEQHTEWLMGKVILVVSNNKTHQMLLIFLTKLLGLYLDFKQIGQLFLSGRIFH